MFEIQRPIAAAGKHAKNSAKPLAVLIAALALLVGLAGPAAAASQTVAGTGTVTKMSVANTTNGVVAKVFGPRFKCDGAALKWVQIVVRDRDGTTYTAKGRCQPGDPENPATGWHVTLERGTTLKACSGDAVEYNRTGGFWRLAVPRPCLTGLANQIKVSAELSASATPGSAGPTAWLSRG